MLGSNCANTVPFIKATTEPTEQIIWKINIYIYIYIQDWNQKDIFIFFYGIKPKASQLHLLLQVFFSKEREQMEN